MTELDKMDIFEFHDWLWSDSEDAIYHKQVMEILKYYSLEMKWVRACRVVYTGIPDPFASQKMIAMVSGWLRRIPSLYPQRNKNGY